MAKLEKVFNMGKEPCRICPPHRPQIPIYTQEDVDAFQENSNNDILLNLMKERVAISERYQRREKYFDTFSEDILLSTPDPRGGQEDEIDALYSLVLEENEPMPKEYEETSIGIMSKTAIRNRNISHIANNQSYRRKLWGILAELNQTKAFCDMARLQKLTFEIEAKITDLQKQK